MSPANRLALPRPDFTQSVRFIGRSIVPNGERLQRPFGEFFISPSANPIEGMNTVEETRRNRLKILVRKYKSMAELCATLGYARTETANLTRIMNENVRHERGGKPYNLGSPTARAIESKLHLPEGWMDTPPSYAELHGESDKRAMVMQLMEALPSDQLDVALRVVGALTQPPTKNGTTG